MSSLLSTALVLVGMAALGRSVLLNRQLTAGLPDGHLRLQWRGMTALALLFIAGYAAFLALSWGSQRGVGDLVVPVVFFFGGCFVWFAARLALRTADDIRRIARLEQETVTDPLTSLFNRRYLDQRLEEEVVRANRYGTPLSVMLLDLDHFKNVNDRLGHHAGDQALVQFSAVIKDALRQSDFVARYGGEEFVVAATQTGPDEADTLAERLCTLIADTEFVLPARFGVCQSIKLTVSIGVANLNDQFDNAAALLCEADNCLYRAKRLGRNRVIPGAVPRNAISSARVSAA